uniref:E3 ubiquitin-protein ligase CHIP n=1 Tax=Aceria tosichella TaxID=561515 RepID=A0A6G1SAA7_9ACAR
MNDLPLTATDYKNAGNKLCASHRYEEAIGFYSKAIAENPKEPLFYSNRALCHLKLKQYPQAIQDCRLALELDPNLLKAHFFIGTALNESGLHDDALKHLQRAHDLAKENRLNFGDDITYQIRLAKRRRWVKIDEENAKLDEELLSYLMRLIKQDREKKQMKQIAGRLEATHVTDLDSSSPLKEPVNQHGDHDDSGHQANLVPTEKQEATDSDSNNHETNPTSSKCDIFVNRLEQVFEQLRMQRKKREVPDHLCGKISFEIMRDPVITPSGITYDRENIEDHLIRVGYFDPITRQPLTANELIPNLAMKEVIDAYLSENEWANYC